MKVAFQGEPGAYSEAAIFEHYGRESQTLPCESFDLVFESVSNGNADYGFLPIENSLAGSIHRNYDLLLQRDLTVVGEHHLHVHHCLITLHEASPSQLRRVISHPQALAQCDGYLRSQNLKPEAVYDTAGSVKIMIEQGDITLASIASRRAAELYGMHILAENIEDNPLNFTRFLIVAREPLSISTNDTKTSIVFALKNEPGALFKALSVFALRDIDLTKIESPPLVGKPWEYFFYIDFAGSTKEDKCHRALEHLTEYATTLRILGSYPRHKQA
ncbi:MAG: prephenate dehydratase [Anaerolineae bacterium]|nr:prephenate dehydratase [Anaerolineae bacterium]